MLKLTAPNESWTCHVCTVTCTVLLLIPEEHRAKWVHNTFRTNDGTATGYGLDGPVIVSRWGWNFPQPSRPSLGPTQPLIRWVPDSLNHPPRSSAEVKERIELYFYFPSGPSRPVLGRNVTFIFTNDVTCTNTRNWLCRKLEGWKVTLWHAEIQDVRVHTMKTTAGVDSMFPPRSAHWRVKSHPQRFFAYVKARCYEQSSASVTCLVPPRNIPLGMMTTRRVGSPMIR